LRLKRRKTLYENATSNGIGAKAPEKEQMEHILSD
jgi:hypothetical protein